MVSKRNIWLMAIAGFLLVNIIIAFHFYDVGKRKVALKATMDSLVVVRKEKSIIAHQRDSVGKALTIATQQSQKTRLIYTQNTNATKIHGDSAFDDETGEFIQILDSRISGRIESADDHIENLENELEKSKFLIKIDTVYIGKVEEESRLNQNIANMIRGSKFSRGIQIGAGYCYGSTGGIPCLYVGYGFSYRF